MIRTLGPVIGEMLSTVRAAPANTTGTPSNSVSGEVTDMSNAAGLFMHQLGRRISAGMVRR